MAKQVLSVGTINNDKTGDSLRAGGLKIKANFDELYTALGAPAAGAGAGILPMHPVCINGRFQDLHDIPPFKPLALSASWSDLENKPLLSILTAPPTGPSGLTGVDGHKRGMIASDNTYFYMCYADWVSPGTDVIWRRIEWNPIGSSAVPTTSLGNNTHKAGMTAADSTYFYYCTADHDGFTDIWKRIQWESGTW